MGGEGDQVDVHRKQHELDGHQDDDDVLAVQEDAEDPQRKEDRGDREVVPEADLQHGHTTLRLGTCFTSTDSARVRAVCRDRKSVEYGQSVSVCVDLGGRGRIKKKKK